ncbi:MAG: hypothetical protein RML37_10355 [Chitinophagales bacterium]|nr:hypothetical protein [Chitinophagales bacterium]
MWRARTERAVRNEVEHGSEAYPVTSPTPEGAREVRARREGGTPKEKLPLFCEV